jgi:hypothetical protein
MAHDNDYSLGCKSLFYSIDFVAFFYMADHNAGVRGTFSRFYA